MKQLRHLAAALLLTVLLHMAAPQELMQAPSSPGAAWANSSWTAG